MDTIAAKWLILPRLAFLRGGDSREEAEVPRWVLENIHNAFQGSTEPPIQDTRMRRVNKVSWWHLLEYGQEKHMLNELTDQMDPAMAVNYIPCFQPLSYELPKNAVIALRPAGVLISF
jgi:hypothetical protein